MEGNRRPRRRRHRTAERLKNVLIVLLAVSALYLSARAQLYGEASNWVNGLLSRIQGEEISPPLDSGGGQPAAAARPMRIAIFSGSDRFAVQYDQEQTGKVYEAVSGLLTEALASAKAPRQITEAEWRRALAREGVYFDFLGKVPLESLYAWLGEGTGNPNLRGTARRILVARGTGDGASLYYHNETDGSYYACETSLTYQGRMADVLENYDGNGAAFAFEYGEQSVYSSLDPYVLILSAAPSPRIYHSGNPLAAGDTDMLNSIQRALSFRPQSNSTYSVPGGVRVREGKESLEILDRGTISYHASEPGASRYAVVEGSAAGVTECIEGARKLAAATIGSLCGSAQLDLIEVEETQQGTVVCFGYSLDGAAVQLSGGGYAARFLIQSGHITDYTLQFRSYEDTGERSFLFREQLAAAALESLDPEGRELTLRYADSGGDTVEAGWVAG